MNWNTLYSSRINSMGHSDVVGILKLAERPDVISFAGGLPDPETFLLEEIKETYEEVVAEKGHTAMNYGPTAGITPLREWLTDYMTKSGRDSRVEECLVTTGAIAAFDLICKVFLDPGDVVIVGEPSYVAALHVIKSYQGRCAGVPLDDEGIQPDMLKSKLEDLQRQSLHPKFIYLVPSFQNPTGITLSETRRKKIIELSITYNVPVIEDAAYHDLRFEGIAPPLLASLCAENIIHINTFSKIFTPGVRLGWVMAPQKLIETLTLAKQGQDQCSTTIGQYIVLVFASKNLIEQQTSKAINIYRRKRDTMLSALAKYFPQSANWTEPQGGFYMWVTVPKEIDTEALLSQAIKDASVAYVAGPAFYHNRSGKNHMRLCYSYVPESKIEEGIRRISHVLAF